MCTDWYDIIVCLCVQVMSTMSRLSHTREALSMGWRYALCIEQLTLLFIYYFL